MSREPLKPEHLEARVIRALSGLTQDEIAEKTGISSSLIDQVEQGKAPAGEDHLERLARCSGFAGADAGELLRYHQIQRGTWLRRGEGTGAILESLLTRLRRYCAGAFERLLKLGLPDRPPAPEDRQEAQEHFAKLKRLSRRSRLAAVKLIEDFQTWALLERCCEESVQQASRNLKRAAAWAQVAQEIARLVRGPDGWCRCLQAYALAHWGNVLRVKGDLNAAEKSIEEAKALWNAGSDPAGLLDPGRLLDLEGSLRRDQRRFDEALALFEQAVPVSRFPERPLMKKGTTYDVMGEHARAIATFLEAEPHVERRGDPRLTYMLRFNLAANYCHLGSYPQAAELVEQVRALVSARGDKIEAARVLWLEGRILAGLGHSLEAQTLLAEARQRFAAEEMTYDVALALLEEAGLLLRDGRTVEVKALTLDLAEVFESKGVHTEAQKALRIFEEAVNRDTATAELARHVLRFLFLARHDPGLRFEA
jgi:tetratricopeptide (TPR) repeat protein